MDPTRVKYVTGENPTVAGNHSESFYEPPFSCGAPPIVAIHGMWATDKRWVHFIDYFTKLGFSFVTSTLRHHRLGSNMSALGKTSVMDYVRDEHRLLDRVRKEVDARPPILIGHSMGGLIAQKIAESRELSALILINSAPSRGIGIHSSLGYKLDVFSYLPQLLFSRAFKPSFEVACRYIMNRMPQESWQGLYNGFVHESGCAAREILFGKISVDGERIKCPVLVMGCGEDKIVPLAVARGLNRKYWSTLRVYDCHGHWPHYESGWEETAHDLLVWITEVLRHKPKSVT